MEYGKNIRVKVFQSWNVNDFQNSVNRWLAENPNIHIIEIKYNAYNLNAMIIYKEEV